jgi:cytochrome c553
MKKIVLGTLVLSVAAFAAVNLGACKGCHGVNLDKANVMGSTSRPLNSLTKMEIQTALLGYKSKSIKKGHGKAFMMYGQVGRFSEADLIAVAQEIGK